MLWNARHYSATARAAYLKAFHKVDLNIGKIGGVLGPLLWYIRFHRICWEMPKNVGTYFIVSIYIQTPNLGPHIYLAVFGRFWNLCSLSFSIQIGRPWWMDPNARAMAKKLRRFVSDLWFIQNTHVHNKYSSKIQIARIVFMLHGTKRIIVGDWKCISRFHLWHKINWKRYVC